MSKSKDLRLVTFKVESKVWKKFLRICSKKDLSGSQVLRDYINLLVQEKLILLGKKISNDLS